MNKKIILVILMMVLVVGSVGGQSIDEKITKAKPGDSLEYQEGSYKQIFTKHTDGSWTQTTIAPDGHKKDFSNQQPPTQTELTGTSVKFTLNNKPETYTPQPEDPPIPTFHERGIIGIPGPSGAQPLTKETEKKVQTQLAAERIQKRWQDLKQKAEEERRAVSEAELAHQVAQATQEAEKIQQQEAVEQQAIEDARTDAEAFAARERQIQLEVEKKRVRELQQEIEAEYAARQAQTEAARKQERLNQMFNRVREASRQAEALEAAGKAHEAQALLDEQERSLAEAVRLQQEALQNARQAEARARDEAELKHWGEVIRQENLALETAKLAQEQAELLEQARQAQEEAATLEKAGQTQEAAAKREQEEYALQQAEQLQQQAARAAALAETTRLLSQERTIEQQRTRLAQEEATLLEQARQAQEEAATLEQAGRAHEAAAKKLLAEQLKQEQKIVEEQKKYWEEQYEEKQAIEAAQLAQEETLALEQSRQKQKEANLAYQEAESLRIAGKTHEAEQKKQEAARAEEEAKQHEEAFLAAQKRKQEFLQGQAEIRKTEEEEKTIVDAARKAAEERARKDTFESFRREERAPPLTEEQKAVLQGTPIAFKSEAASWWQHQEATFSWDQGKGKWIATVGGNKYLADDLENQYWMPKDIIEKGKELMKFAPDIKTRVQGITELETAGFKPTIIPEKPEQIQQRKDREQAQHIRLQERHTYTISPGTTGSSIGALVDVNTHERVVFYAFDQGGNVIAVEPVDPENPSPNLEKYRQELMGKNEKEINAKYSGILKPTKEPTPVSGAPAAAPTIVAGQVQKDIRAQQTTINILTTFIKQAEDEITLLKAKLSGGVNDEEASEIGKRIAKLRQLQAERKNNIEDARKKLAELQTTSGVALGSAPPAAAKPTIKKEDLTKEQLEKRQKELKTQIPGLEEAVNTWRNAVQSYDDEINKLKSAIEKENDPTKKADLENELKIAEATKTRNEQRLKETKDELKKARGELGTVSADLKYLQFKEENPAKKIITVMRALTKSYDMYSGLARFGSMFLTDKSWTDWRNDVNKVLCDTIILGGKQCWISKICDQYIDATPGGNSLIARTPGGPKGVVNLQAERSLPIEVPGEGTQFIYKLTYTIANPHDKTMHYNLRFHTKDGTYEAFKPNKEIQPGGSDGKTGSAAFHKQSNKDYTQVCLVWRPSIESWDKRSVSEFCEPITQYEGAATNPYTNLPTQPGTCSDGLRNQGETGTDCGGSCPACGTAQKPTEFDGF